MAVQLFPKGSIGDTLSKALGRRPKVKNKNFLLKGRKKKKKQRSK